MIKIYDIHGIIKSRVGKRIAGMIEKELDRREVQEKNEIVDSGAYKILIASVQEYIDNGGDHAIIPTSGLVF